MNFWIFLIGVIIAIIGVVIYFPNALWATPESIASSSFWAAIGLILTFFGVVIGIIGFRAE